MEVELFAICRNGSDGTPMDRSEHVGIFKMKENNIVVVIFGAKDLLLRPELDRYTIAPVGETGIKFSQETQSST